MTIPDANIPLYAYNVDAEQQPAASAWLKRTVAEDVVGIPVPVIWAFLRISTARRIWAHPLSPTQAFATIHELLGHPKVRLIDAGPRHFDILESLLTEFNITGPRVSDAVLAAMAIEHGATLVSTDRDFSRFENLRWVNPLA